MKLLVVESACTRQVIIAGELLAEKPICQDLCSKRVPFGFGAMAFAPARCATHPPWLACELSRNPGRRLTRASRLPRRSSM